MNDNHDTSGFFRARIIKDGRITVDAYVREIFDLKEGDLCRWRLVSVISRKQDVQEAPTE
jgi:hypothetical protein